jgi:hypothetical protein
LGAVKANALEYLELNAGKDSLEDRYLVGLIAGVNSVLNITLEDLQEESSDDR